jgi:hypothetical protein
MARRAIPTALAPFKGKAIIGNDDEDVVFTGPISHKVAEEYLNIEHDIHGSLGNLTNFQKSVVMPFGLFYETYDKDGWRDKESLVCNALACAYLAPDIRVAKTYISSQSDRFNSPWARSQLKTLIEWWGAEFFNTKQEYLCSFEIGGWLNRTENGLKTTLCDLDILLRHYDIRYLSYVVKYCKLHITPPSPQKRSDGGVSNFRYSGIAQKTVPEVQIYTITDADLRTYYRKLTSYQRKFGRRMETFYKKARSIKVFNDLRSLQVYMLKDNPWYQIPESLVLEDKNWEGTFQLTFHHELEGENQDEIETLLSFFKRERDEIYYEHLKWNPNIPIDFHKYTVGIDAWQQYTCSQFSNCGFSPALDYYLREGFYPVCKIAGRCRLPSMVGDKEHTIHPLSRFRRRDDRRKTEDVREWTFLTASEVIPEPESLDEILKGLKRPDLEEAANRLLPDRPSAAEQEAGLQRAELMLEAMTNRLDTRVVMEQLGLFQDEPEIDIFDNDDEDLGLDFGF